MLRSGFIYNPKDERPERVQQTEHTAMRRLQYKLPIAPYNGNSSILIFFNQLEKLRVVKKWDAAETCAWIAVLLEGQASLYYDSLRDAIKTDYAQLKDALIAKYNTIEVQALKLQQLNKIAQYEGESVTRYYTRMMELAEIAYGTLDYDQRQPLMLNHFRQGLLPVIKKQVVLSGPEELDTALEIALRVESNFYLYKNEGHMKYSNNYNSSSRFNKNRMNYTTQDKRPTQSAYNLRVNNTTTNTNRDYGNRNYVSQRQQYQPQNYSKYNYNNGMKTISMSLRCYKCGRNGHSQQNCRAPVAPKKCFNCGKIGHVQSECRYNKVNGRSDPRIPNRVNFVQDCPANQPGSSQD